ncbi:hypothetical protein [Altererythrobacter lutimaris]|uniref:Uncharacterized protein n=1 Tax=Altererythrobacter lutimaris TaxID=2743979 RepID=A0A850HFE5_9SPHN|nr:hypothetical protein [Altererythrobacter lutimaris]NVE96001.1 hypothetical protein [Altererythrobacter lutimaris]
MADVPKSKFNAFWAIVIALLIIAGVWAFFGDAFSGSEVPAEEPQPPSTEWTTAPEGGVEVDLPETPMRAAEPEAQQQESTNASGTE